MFKLCIAFALAATVLAANLDKDAYIEKYDSVVNPDGSFRYAVQTSNGIAAESQGDQNGNVQGSYSWISPEGEDVGISYIADDYGYRASGRSIPTPPPIPEHIIKALRYIAENPPAPERK